MQNPNGLVVESILTETVSTDTTKHWGVVSNNTSGKFVFFVGHPWSSNNRLAKRSNYIIQRAQRMAFDRLGSEIDIFDAFAFTFPQIYDEVCDGSHVNCVISDQLSLFTNWEILILSQVM